MLEARVADGDLFRRIIDSVKDLVAKANLNCGTETMSLQAMDTSHVSLIYLSLSSESFQAYRADRNISLGLDIPALANVFKCMGGKESMTLRAADDAETVTIVFENEGMDCRINSEVLKPTDPLV